MPFESAWIFVCTECTYVSAAPLQFIFLANQNSKRHCYVTQSVAAKTLSNCRFIQRRRKVWDGAKPQGVWGRESPSGIQGRSPGRGSGDEVPQKLKNFTKYAKWGGAFDTVCPLVCKWGDNCPLCPRLRRLWVYHHHHHCRHRVVGAPLCSPWPSQIYTA